jgi:hypothetical protein
MREGLTLRSSCAKLAIPRDPFRLKSVLAHP